MSPTSTARSRSLRQSGTPLPILRDAARATIGLNVRSSGNLKLQRRREAVEIHRLAGNAGDNAESATRNVMPQRVIAYRGLLSFSVVRHSIRSEVRSPHR